ncbi:hypothetical protein [Sutcliffiella cohnii]|uniref:hypothetical protein n=1 Tax=Sutcliffiella cohnii TaxID=33932 RepID=UPI002E1C9164|nr:hypothetical protein [Sutcliffiella cohnii]
MWKYFWSVITIIVIVTLNFGLATIFDTNFIDWLFLSGLAVTMVLLFFNSSGGFTSDLADARLQGANNDEFWPATEVLTKIDRQKVSFSPRISFYVALSYTVVAGIVSIFYYFV